MTLDFLNAWRSAHPGARVTVRDTNLIPHLGGEPLQGLMSPADSRTSAQHQAAAFADELIAEVEAADTIVIAAPMYNFNDFIATEGLDRPYRARRPHLALHRIRSGRAVEEQESVRASRGGLYTEGPGKAMDFQEPYLRAMLGFLGMME